jgi:hypothetical protein
MHKSVIEALQTYMKQADISNCVPAWSSVIYHERCFSGPFAMSIFEKHEYLLIVIAYVV